VSETSLDKSYNSRPVMAEPNASDQRIKMKFLENRLVNMEAIGHGREIWMICSIRESWLANGCVREN